MSDAAHDHHALHVVAVDRPGLLHRVCGVLADIGANITHIDISDRNGDASRLHLECWTTATADALMEAVRRVPGVTEVVVAQPDARVYGKRIIVIGGGAQVGQVAMGAVSEADRHNIRGERISVDTIPLVGEKALATAVRHVLHLPRARLIVLAGALMGGEITDAVREVRDKGLLVISLNMAGSVPSVADLVVSDPVQAGVMAVMAIADTAQFDLHRQKQRRY